MKKNELKVIIVGAGIGGLTAAAHLLKRGFDVRVYEQASVLAEVGAGIQSSANAVKVLYDLGLKEKLDAFAVRPQAFEFRRFDTAELMHRIPLGSTHERAFGAPYFHLHRADLHDLLAKTVDQMDPDCISLNAKAKHFEESANGVALHLLDGRVIHGDVLIGADGIKSVVRAQILGPTPVSYTGDIAWRGLIPVEKLPKDIMQTVSTVWCGPKKHAVMYYLRAGALMNFVGLVEHDQPEEESWTQKRPWEELKKDFEGWHPSIQTVIDAIDHDACYRYALNNRPPVANWSTERATLLGDAAHPTLPYMASGAAMAIEDAAVIARCLEQCSHVPQALQLFQSMRMERTSKVVLGSTQSRGLYRIEDVEQMRSAFKAQDLTKSRAEWLYSYDPLQVPLG
jgi:salicylate hydroxylase